jgi:SWI/SNF-related matrix-associated actin-dependent regulator of chromatin subfamily A3
MKTRAIVKQVNKRLAEDEGQIPVFDHFVPNVELFEIAFEGSNISCVKIHGLVKTRSQKIEQFMDRNGLRVMVATTSTIGAGHNLTVATTVMLGTPAYTPSVEEQAIARILRIGCKRSPQYLTSFALSPKIP